MNATVLILDDEVWISTAVSEILEDQGILVAGPFRSNRQVLAHLADNKPDAAILDFDVADGTSRPSAARLLEMQVPFLIISGYPKLVARDPEFLTAEWLDKPFGENALMAGVNGMLMQAGGKAAAA